VGIIIEKSNVNANREALGYNAKINMAKAAPPNGKVKETSSE
jgi:hypothetical protein